MVYNITETEYNILSQNEHKTIEHVLMYLTSFTNV